MCMPRCNDSPRAAVSASPRSTPPSPLRSSPPALLADFSLHRQLHLLGVDFVNPNRGLGRMAMRRSASALHLSSASTTSTSARPWPLRRHVHRRGRGRRRHYAPSRAPRCALHHRARRKSDSISKGSESRQPKTSARSHHCQYQLFVASCSIWRSWCDLGGAQSMIKQRLFHQQLPTWPSTDMWEAPVGNCW